MTSQITNPPASKEKIGPSLPRSVGFGLMLFAWWIFSIEIPRWNIYRLGHMRGLVLSMAQITEWVYGVANLWSHYRGLAVVIIIIAVPVHYFLWKRRMQYDTWGRWLFKAGFMTFYVIMYAFFLFMLLGAELPIYTNPAADLP